jgi:NAD+ synthase
MKATERVRKSLRIRPAAVKRKLVRFIQRKVGEARAEGVVLGMSGGMDSSTTAYLCVDALGPERVLGVSMPEAGVTDPHDVADARLVASKLGIRLRVVDITPAIIGMRKNITGFRIDALIPAANMKPRIRMAILYYYANLYDRLVIGPSNRSELRAGYFTKFGDGAADLLPLGCLYKTQVKQLAGYLGVPKRIIQKVPSAGLWRGQTDESELGLTYDKLDLIYAGLDLGLKPSVIAEAAGVKEKEVRRFIRREKQAAHKLKVPEIPKL